MERGRNRECGRRSGDSKRCNLGLRFVRSGGSKKEGGRVLREIIPRLAYLEKMETAQDTLIKDWNGETGTYSRGKSFTSPWLSQSAVCRWEIRLNGAFLEFENGAILLINKLRK